MAISDDVSVCNLALIKMGHKGTGITSLTASTEAARKCNVLYEPIRDDLLAQHPWKFALKRVVFDVDDYLKTITGVTQADPVVVTAASHGISEGQGVYITGTGVEDIDGGVFVATTVAASTLELYKLDRTNSVDGSAYDAYVSGGTLRMSPLDEYQYMYPLPSDCLTVHRVVDPASYKYDVEEGHLIIDADEVSVVYIAKITTVTNWSDSFIDAFATRMAAELSVALAGKPENKTQFLKELEAEIIPKAKRLNAIQALPNFEGNIADPSEETSWQAAGR